MTPYIGYRIKDNLDMYVLGGIKAQRTKYGVGLSKTKIYPTLGLGICHTYKNGIYVKCEYSYTIKKSQRLYNKGKLETFFRRDVGSNPDVEMSAKINHSEHVFKFGIGYKFKFKSV